MSVCVMRAGRGISSMCSLGVTNILRMELFLEQALWDDREKQPVTIPREKQPVTGFSSHGVSITT